MRRASRLLVAVLAAAAAVTGVSGAINAAPTAAAAPADAVAAAPPPAVESPGTSPAAVELSQLTPVVPKVGDTLTISGKTTNRSQSTLRNLSLVLRFSTVPIDDRAQLSQIANGSGERDGQPVRSSVPADLAPGASIPFRFAIPLANLDLGSQGVYSFAVEAVDDGGTAGSARTFLPWFPDPKAITPISLVWLWPVASPGARDAANVLIGGGAVSQFQRGGPLATIEAAGATRATGVSWLIDPQTMQQADVLSESHVVLEGGREVAGTGSAAAREWIAGLRKATAVADVSALPYSFPDVVGDVRGGLGGDLVLAATSAPTLLTDQLQRPVRGGVVWPNEQRLDQPTLNALKAAGATTVVLDAAGLGTSQDSTSNPFSQVRADSGLVTAVSPDPGLGALLDTPATNPVLARQRFLAETAMIASADPTLGPTVVAAPPMFWSPGTELTDTLNASATAPWSKLTSLGEALSSAGSLSERPLADVDIATLSPEHLAAVRQDVATLASISAIMNAPGAELQTYREALLRCESAAWILSADIGRELLARTTVQVTQERDRVHITSAGTISFPGSKGRVPITVANDTEVPVTVGLALTAAPAYRIEVAPIRDIRIPPRGKVSLEVPVTLVGSGSLAVSGQLLTPDGQPYGPPEQVDLRTTAYSRAAAWVVGSAFLLLCVFLAVSFVRRRREKRAGR